MEVAEGMELAESEELVKGMELVGGMELVKDIELAEGMELVKGIEVVIGTVIIADKELVEVAKIVDRVELTDGAELVVVVVSNNNFSWPAVTVKVPLKSKSSEGIVYVSKRVSKVVVGAVICAVVARKQHPWDKLLVKMHASV